jgi:RNA polymerase sigma-70 factor (ECF subfamily)
MKPTDDPQPAEFQLAEHLFRHESGKIVSILTGIYGTRNLQLAEDVVQDAMIRALKTWPLGGAPENPAAWLLRTAKNLAIDHLRREKIFLGKQDAIIAETEDKAHHDEAGSDGEGFSDDQLRLMFVCCHPALAQEAQVALALKTLCGFSPAEIATAFLISEAAVSKRLVRARRQIRDACIPFEIPEAGELPGRLEGVLETLYLLFNEGHKASHGDEVVRADLCMEAIRMTSLLASHPVGNMTHTHALAAMMAFTAARLPARTDAEGCLVLLENQDRRKWDRKMIQTGIRHLATSKAGTDLGEYHIQAGIAACHTLAPSDRETDWPRIVMLYDKLMELRPSPVIALNRAVAISKTSGPAAGISEIENPAVNGQLENYHLLHAVLGELEMRRGDLRKAAGHFRRALALAETRPERSHLSQRLEECETT